MSLDTDGNDYVSVVLSGLIDAANYQRFESELDSALDFGARFLLLNFESVEYINSTGISALIRHGEAYTQRKGCLCLVGVPQEVGVSMHLLGVTSLIPFRSGEQQALELFRSVVAGKKIELAPAAKKKTSSRSASPASPLQTEPRSASNVLVLAPRETRFTRVLAKRFSEYKKDHYHLLHDPFQALRSFEEIQPDLVVVDDRCDPNGEFVSRLKVQKERSLTSVIKTYPKNSSVRDSVDFKIWENDFLVDPFDVLQFFSLTEAELSRVPKDRKVFRQQVHIEFRSTQDNIEKAYLIADLVVR
ncbi:MAG: STAS domain-containing protein, partial [Planctomycetota bacterium]